MSEILSFTVAFIAVQIFKIIMFKKDKDYSGYDERQELIRGRAFRYGFLTLAFSLAAVTLWEECVGALPIEFSLLMMACLMVGCLVVILYDIWKDAYWGIRQASGSNAAIVLMVAVMVMQYLSFRGACQCWQRDRRWHPHRDGGIYLLIFAFFALIIVNLLLKAWVDKRGRFGGMKNLKMKSARAALDLSQQQLADLVGVSRQTINAIEKGDYNPTIRLCIAICRALNRTLDELFWEEP